MNSKLSRMWRLSMILTLASLPVAMYASHSWGGYHWARTSNPFTLKLGDTVKSVWDSYLQTASQKWNVSSVLDTTIVPGGSSSRNCKSTTGRVEVCSSAYGNNGWLGIAQIWISGTHITKGVVKVNDTYFNSAPYNDPGWRNLVMCQEIGHTFGLDHVDESFGNPNQGTCMDYTNNPYGPPDNQFPNQHDYDQLANIYAHSDSSTTVGQAGPSAMDDIEFSGPEQWGRVVKGSREKGVSVHELDFGHGHKIFTFVYWVRDLGLN